MAGGAPFAAMLALALIAGACGRRGTPDVRIEIDGTFANATLPSGAWSPDGRAFVVYTSRGMLAIGRTLNVVAPSRFVIERSVTDHAWSPSGLRLACRSESRRARIGRKTYDVVVVEHDTLATLVSDRDVWGLVWLSDTSLWARHGPGGGLVHLASFAADSAADGMLVPLTTTGFNVILPARPLWGPVPTILVGPSECMPPGSLEIAGAPGFRQFEILGDSQFRCEASNAATKQFLGWFHDEPPRRSGDALLDSAGTFVRRTSVHRSVSFQLLDFSRDGSILLGREDDFSQEGVRATRPIAVATDGSWPARRIKGPPVVDLQVSPRGDRVLLAGAGGDVSLGRVEIRR